MKKLLLGPVLALVFAAPAAAQVVSYTSTQKNGTITSGGVAQVAIEANIYRLTYCIQNDPDETENLMVAQGATASATVGTAVEPGKQVCNPFGFIDRGAVSVWASTTGHRWRGFEGR